jgi:hypothetical protein
MGLVAKEERGPHSLSQLPLSKEVIMQLTRLLDMQMTESLFRAVTGNDAENKESTSGDRLLEWPETVHPPNSPPQQSQDLPAVEKPPERTTKQTASVPIDQIITQASEIYGIEPALIRAVIKAESNFDPRATSPVGAMGLMQLMPETARDLGVKEPYDPEENIMAGTRYLGILLDRYDGNIPLALAGYNWGMGNVERHPGKLPQETRTYISRVNQYYRDATI